MSSTLEPYKITSAPSGLNRYGTYRVTSRDSSKPPMSFTKTGWTKTNYPISIQAEEQLVIMNPLEMRMEDYFNIRTNNLTNAHKTKLTEAISKNRFGVEIFNYPPKLIPNTINKQSNPINIQSTPLSSTPFNTTSTNSTPNINVFKNSTSQQSSNSNTSTNMFSSSQNIFKVGNTSAPQTTTNNTLNFLNNQNTSVQNIFKTGNTGSVLPNMFNNNSNTSTANSSIANIFNNTNNSNNNVNNLNNLNNNFSNVNQNNIFLNTSTPQTVNNQLLSTQNQFVQSSAFIIPIFVPIPQEMYQTIISSKNSQYSSKQKSKTPSSSNIVICSYNQPKDKTNRTKVFKFNILREEKQQEEQQYQISKSFVERILAKKTITFSQSFSVDNSFSGEIKNVRVYQSIWSEGKFVQERGIMIELYGDFNVDLMKKLIQDQYKEQKSLKIAPNVQIINHSKQPYEVTCEIRIKLIDLPLGYYYQIKGQLKNGEAEGLIIGNNYGQVRWNDKINIEEIDFSQNVVTINRNSVTLYENEGSPPPKDTGLNKPCILTLFSCQITQKMKIAGSYTKRNAEQKLYRICQKIGQEFISYDEVTNHWKILISPK